MGSIHEKNQGPEISCYRTFKEHLYSAEITQKQPLFLLKKRFFHKTMKSQKSSGIFFCEIAEFDSVIGGQSLSGPDNCRAVSCTTSLAEL
jgi:hypothetical protein